MATDKMERPLPHDAKAPHESRNISSSEPHPAPGVRMVSCRGLRFNVSAEPWPSFWTRMENGRWEPSTLEVFDRYVQPGTVVLDIGSWIGPTVLYAAARGASVICLEPDPVALAQLRANVALNTDFVDRVTILGKAVHPSGKPIQFGSLTTGGDSVSSFVHSGMNTVWTVDTITPTELAEMIDPEQRLFVKMDIEGGEYEVVPSADALWSRRNATLFLSLHPKRIEPSKRKRFHRISPLTRAVFRALAGYHAYRVDRKRISIVRRPLTAWAGRRGLAGWRRLDSWLFVR